MLEKRAGVKLRSKSANGRRRNWWKSVTDFVKSVGSSMNFWAIYYWKEKGIVKLCSVHIYRSGRVIRKRIYE